MKHLMKHAPGVVAVVIAVSVLLSGCESSDSAAKTLDGTWSISTAATGGTAVGSGSYSGEGSYDGRTGTFTMTR